MQNHSPFRHYRERSSTHNQLHLQQTVGLKKNYIQQQQIEDLQKKVNIILMHNQKLVQQNSHLKHTIRHIETSSNTDRYVQGSTARFIAQQTELLVIQLKNDLQLTKKSYQIRFQQILNQKDNLKDEIITLNQIIKNMRTQNISLKSQLNLKYQQFNDQVYKSKQELARLQSELQEKLKDQILIKEQQMQNNIKNIQKQSQKNIQVKDKLNQEEKQQVKNNFEKIVKRLNQNNSKQIEQIKKQLQNNFNSKLSEFEDCYNQRLRNQRDKAQTYIKQSISNIKNDQDNIKSQLQSQIQNLKDSLQSRKLLINQLISDSQPTQKQMNWYQQFLQLKNKVKQITDYYLKQSEILKLKIVQKHQIDINSMVKIYQDKIDLMNLHIRRVESQNDHLRNLYEDSLNQKISQKKQFQIQISKLKNLIRKLKVELHGIQEEFRINIQGVRQNNNTFSMTMMKSMIQIKDKENFYEQQNRKLRKAYQQHQVEVYQAKKQCQQKSNYFQEKYACLKQKVEDQLEQYRINQQNLISDSEKRQNMLRQSLEKEHQLNKITILQLRKDIQKLQKSISQLKIRNNELQLSFKDKQEDIQYYRTSCEQKQADIQRLKMDLQMAGVNDKDKIDTINQWKNHYERQLQALNTDKQILKSQLDQKQNHLCEIIKKYKVLEGSLQKSVETLKKRSLLDIKVMELGLDNSLVKNLAEIFAVQV